MSIPLRNITIFFAGLMGLAGVALAASASHGDARLLGSASTMCLAHAPALIALYAAWPHLRTAPIAAILFILGTTLFAGDLLVRQGTAQGLFPLSAPIGGIAMMGGWVAVTLGALLRPR